MAAKEWALRGVLSEARKVDRTMEDRSFCFILGAGASRSSGIPTGGELAQQWLTELWERECPDSRAYEAWIEGNPLNIQGFDPGSPAAHYAQIFSRRFGHDKKSGYAALEESMKDKTPSLGYSLLARIMDRTRHRIVVTTNFDNLLSNTLIINSANQPLVVGHEALAVFISPTKNRPTIAKIHRDLFMNPASDEKGVGTLAQGWAEALTLILSFCTPIFVGYGGNDGSLMDFLAQLDPSKINGSPIWCLCDGEPPNPRITSVMDHHDGIFTRISGFDEFMMLLASELLPNFKHDDVWEEMEKQGKKRADHYKQQSEDLAAKQPSKTNKQDGGETAEQSLVRQALSTAFKSKHWWDWQAQISQESNPDKKEALFEQGIAATNAAPLMGNYALFLKNIRKDMDRAEDFYRRAIDADPMFANALANYAAFLETIRKDMDRAEDFYRRAIDADPMHANALGNYASFLHTIRKDPDRAEDFYRRAIDADPKHVLALGNYANFLKTIRKDMDKAEDFYCRAIDADPKHANTLGNFSAWKLGRGDWDGAARLAARSLTLPPQPEQTWAEAALYLAVTQEVKGQDGTPAWGIVKRLLDEGYARGTWDFTPVYDALRGVLAPERLEFAQAVGDAILDEDKVASLRDLAQWQALAPLTLQQQQDWLASLPQPD